MGIFNYSILFLVYYHSNKSGITSPKDKGRGFLFFNKQKSLKLYLHIFPLKSDHVPFHHTASTVTGLLGRHI